MSFKRFIPSAALWFLVTAGMSLAGPAEATGYFRHHYYQPYGHYYPRHGYRHHYRPHFYGYGYGHHPYSRHRGYYYPPRGFHSSGYYKPLIHHAIDAIVSPGLYGHYYHYYR
ncbi:MAG: hypothetical protein ACRED0_04110 [Gammaproteobacteria bacterium]